jgi:hypothetical protein
MLKGVCWVSFYRMSFWSDLYFWVSFWCVSFYWMSFWSFCAVECHYAECYSAECHFAECHSAEFCSAKCHSNNCLEECRSIECWSANCHRAECYYSECCGANLCSIWFLSWKWRVSSHDGWSVFNLHILSDRDKLDLVLSHFANLSFYQLKILSTSYFVNWSFC